MESQRVKVIPQTTNEIGYDPAAVNNDNENLIHEEDLKHLQEEYGETSNAKIQNIL